MLSTVGGYRLNTDLEIRPQRCLFFPRILVGRLPRWPLRQQVELVGESPLKSGP
jgi:hypothetical protein